MWNRRTPHLNRLAAHGEKRAEQDDVEALLSDRFAPGSPFKRIRTGLGGLNKVRNKSRQRPDYVYIYMGTVILHLDLLLLIQFLP